jgi:hypothetical protein
MLVCILAAASAVAVVIVASRVFRKPSGDPKPGETDIETPRHSGAMLSALFLLVFAMAIVVPWTTADSARQNTYAESQAVVEAYWSASALPAPASGQVQAELRDYALFVRDREWPLMAEKRLSKDGWSRLDTLRTHVTGLRVTSDDTRDARAAVLGELRNLSAARYRRAADASATPPAGLLLLTIVAGLAVIIFPFVAGARPRGKALAPLVVMAALLGVGVYLAFNISHVFTGGLTVEPDAFTAALQEFQRTSGGG